MHTDPFRRPEIAEIMCGGVDKLTARGVGRRTAVRRIARKHGVGSGTVVAMTARVDEREGGFSR